MTKGGDDVENSYDQASRNDRWKCRHSFGRLIRGDAVHARPLGRNAVADKRLPLRFRAPWPAPIRVLTAVPICDGHDSAINTINLEFIRHGIEVVYLGYHRYAEDIVRAAIQEDVARHRHLQLQRRARRIFCRSRAATEEAGRRRHQGLRRRRRNDHARRPARHAATRRRQDFFRRHLADRHGGVCPRRYGETRKARARGENRGHASSRGS